MLLFFFVHRNQIASSSDVGGSCYTCDHGEGRKLQFLQFKILLLFFVSIVEILNFIAICGRTGKLFSASSMHPMISLLFFSGDYHFCILLSDSFIGIYAVFCLHPWYRLAFNSFVFLFRWFRANFWQLNCELSIQWLDSPFCRCFLWQFADCEHGLL